MTEQPMLPGFDGQPITEQLFVTLEVIDNRSDLIMQADRDVYTMAIWTEDRYWSGIKLSQDVYKALQEADDKALIYLSPRTTRWQRLVHVRTAVLPIDYILRVSAAFQWQFRADEPPPLIVDVWISDKLRIGPDTALAFGLDLAGLNKQ